MPIVEYNPEGENPIEGEDRLAPKRKEGPRLLDEDTVGRAAQQFAGDAGLEELTIEQEEAFLDVYRRLEGQVLEANRGQS